MHIARIPPFGRAVLTLAFVRYEDGDLDAYNEFGVMFFVRGPKGRGVYVHHLPVNQEFTLAAGRELWGFPKFLADITIDEKPDRATCTVRHEGRDVIEITSAPGLFPLPQPALRTYTYLDGALRATSWRMKGLARAFLGGTQVQLGSHPIADELRALGLPRKARMTSAVKRFRAQFDPAQVLTRQQPR